MLQGTGEVEASNFGGGVAEDGPFGVGPGSLVETTEQCNLRWVSDGEGFVVPGAARESRGGRGDDAEPDVGIPWGRVAPPPPPRAGYSSGTSRAAAAAATWLFRRNGSLRVGPPRRGGTRPLAAASPRRVKTAQILTPSFEDWTEYLSAVAILVLVFGFALANAGGFGGG